MANLYGGSLTNGSLSEIDNTTGGVTQINDASCAEPQHLYADGTNVWVINSGESDVSKVAP